MNQAQSEKKNREYAKRIKTSQKKMHCKIINTQPTRELKLRFLIGFGYVERATDLLARQNFASDVNALAMQRINELRG